MIGRCYFCGNEADGDDFKLGQMYIFVCHDGKCYTEMCKMESEIARDEEERARYEAEKDNYGRYRNF